MPRSSSCSAPRSPFGYPMLLERLPPTPIGAWPVYGPMKGFMTIDVHLRPEDAPVLVYVDLVSAGSSKFEKDRAVLTLTAAADGGTALAAPLAFDDAAVRDDAPQTPELIYRTKAGTIDPVEAGALYRFTTGPGDAERVDISKVNLVLEHGRGKADPRVQPIGFAVLAIGAIALLRSFRSRGGGPPTNPNSKPPPPRWGRAGGDRK